MKFRSTVLLGGKTATGLTVPADVVEALGPSRKPAVRVTVGGHTYRSTIGQRSGQYLLPLAAEHRAAAGVSAGDEVEVEVELDTEERAVEVPPDLAAALAQDAVASEFFEGLSFSNQRWYQLWIEGAKKADTRAGRVSKAVEMLREGRKQG